MGLVSAKEIARVIKLDNYGVLGTLTGWILMKVLKISQLNKIYDRNKHLEDVTFLNAILNEFQIEFEIDPEELKRLPKQGPYITISNHPLGGIDGILLLKLMREHDPDFKIIANFLLHRIEPLKPYIMAVNPFENHKDSKSSVLGLKETLKHLKEGKPLGIFPAGEVSNFEEDDKIVDKPWEEGALKLIKKAQVPVIPIYIHAKTRTLFYMLSKISPTLQTAKLPSELLTQKDRVIRVRIGKPITVTEQTEHGDTLENFGKFLRQKTYLLANTTKDDKKQYIKIPSFKLPTPPPKEIEHPVMQDLMV